MTHEDKKKFIINVIYILTVIGVLYFILNYVIWWIMPFIIGFFIAYILKPVTNLIVRVTKVKNKSVSIFVISFFYVVIIGVVVLATANIWDRVYGLITLFPHIYYENIEPMILSANDWIVGYIEAFFPELAEVVADNFNEILTILTSAASNLSKPILSALKEIASRLPVYFITLLFSIICSVFITIDYDNVTAFLEKQIPKHIQVILIDVKEFLVGTIFKMIKAYFILLFIAFIEMCIGFIILGVNYAIPLASLIALLDIIPLIGIGGILAPWGIYEIIIGDSSRGVGLLVLYAVVYVVRNLLEPRIVGKQIGLNSLVTVVAMFAGFKIFGFIGFMIAPIIAILIKYLNDSKKIHIYR